MAAAGRFPAVGDGVLVLHPVGTAEVDVPDGRCVASQVRFDEGRDPDASAGLMDSQSVKGRRHPRLRRGQEDQRPEAVHRDRYPGLLLIVLVLPASVQDRDGAKNCCWSCVTANSCPGPVVCATCSPMAGSPAPRWPALAHCRRPRSRSRCTESCSAVGDA